MCCSDHLPLPLYATTNFNLYVELTSVRRIAFVVQVPVTCEADDTANFEGIPPVVGAPASLFRLVLSEV